MYCFQKMNTLHTICEGGSVFLINSSLIFFIWVVSKKGEENHFFSLMQRK